MPEMDNFKNYQLLINEINNNEELKKAFICPIVTNFSELIQLIEDKGIKFLTEDKEILYEDKNELISITNQEDFVDVLNYHKTQTTETLIKFLIKDSIKDIFESFTNKPLAQTLLIETNPTTYNIENEAEEIENSSNYINNNQSFKKFKVLKNMKKSCDNLFMLNYLNNNQTDNPINMKNFTYNLNVLEMKKDISSINNNVEHLIQSFSTINSLLENNNQVLIKAFEDKINEKIIDLSNVVDKKISNFLNVINEKFSSEKADKERVNYTTVDISSKIPINPLNPISSNLITFANFSDNIKEDKSLGVNNINQDKCKNDNHQENENLNSLNKNSIILNENNTNTVYDIDYNFSAFETYLNKEDNKCNDNSNIGNNNPGSNLNDVYIENENLKKDLEDLQKFLEYDGNNPNKQEKSVGISCSTNHIKPISTLDIGVINNENKSPNLLGNIESSGNCNNTNNYDNEAIKKIDKINENAVINKFNIKIKYHSKKNNHNNRKQKKNKNIRYQSDGDLSDYTKEKTESNYLKYFSNHISNPNIYINSDFIEEEQVVNEHVPELEPVGLYNTESNILSEKYPNINLHQEYASESSPCSNTYNTNVNYIDNLSNKLPTIEEKPQQKCCFCKSTIEYSLYKCLVCDVSLCKNCEAHHSDHPLVKLQSPENDIFRQYLSIFKFMNNNNSYNFSDNNEEKLFEGILQDKDFINLKSLFNTKNPVSIQFDMLSYLNYDNAFGSREKLEGNIKKFYFNKTPNEEFELNFLVKNMSDFKIEKSELLFSAKNNSHLRILSKLNTNVVYSNFTVNESIKIKMPEKNGEYPLELIGLHRTRLVLQNQLILIFKVISN